MCFYFSYTPHATPCFWMFLSVHPNMCLLVLLFCFALLLPPVSFFYPPSSLCPLHPASCVLRPRPVLGSSSLTLRSRLLRPHLPFSILASSSPVFSSPSPSSVLRSCILRPRLLQPLGLCWMEPRLRMPSAPSTTARCAAAASAWRCSPQTHCSAWPTCYTPSPASSSRSWCAPTATLSAASWCIASWRGTPRAMASWSTWRRTQRPAHALSCWAGHRYCSHIEMSRTVEVGRGLWVEVRVMANSYIKPYLIKLHPQALLILSKW